MLNTNDVSTSASTGRYSPHPNELYVHHGKLSIQSQIERYDDNLTCCLPPPSPAPNNDHYLVGLMASAAAAADGANSTSTTATTCIPGGNVVNGASCMGAGGHMHSQHVNFDCNKLQQLHQQQQQQQQTAPSLLSASTSISSLSTNSGSSSTSLANNNSGINGKSIPHAMSLSHKYISNSSLQCSSISTNSRFRISDRYRELPTSASPSKSTVADGKTASRYASASDFLVQNNAPHVSSDTYAYLSSTVHTPVKRYVPTPPPPNELYTDVAIGNAVGPASTTIASAGLPLNSLGNSGNKSNRGGVSCLQTVINASPQHVNTLPYRLRMKCCMNEQQQILPPPPNTSHHISTHHQHLEQNHHALTVTDYYGTSPRTRSANLSSYNSNKCSMVVAASNSAGIVKEHEHQITVTPIKTSNSTCMSAASAVICSSACTVAASTAASGTVIAAGNTRINSSSRSTACMAPLSDYGTISCTSSEYINTSTSTNSNNNAQNVIGNRSVHTPINENTGNGSGSATCLHCNTVRRTTGVHQTTQTTGPISPIPMPPQAAALNGGGGGGFTNSCLSVLHDQQTSSTLSPSTSESHISPLSPAISNATHHSFTIQQQQQQQSRDGIEQQQQQPLEFAGYQQMYIQQKSSSQNHTQAQQQIEHTAAAAAQIKIPLLERSTNSITLSNQQQQQQQRSAQQKSQQSVSVGNRHLTLQQKRPQSPQQQQQLSATQHRYSRKKRLNKYFRKKIARFFGVEVSSELEESALWNGRQRRLALRRFGALKTGGDLQAELHSNNSAYRSNDLGNRFTHCGVGNCNTQIQHCSHTSSDRPDILPAHDAAEDHEHHHSADIGNNSRGYNRAENLLNSYPHFYNNDFKYGEYVERKASVAAMIMSSLAYIVRTLNKRRQRHYHQWSRSFAPAHVAHATSNVENANDVAECVPVIQEEEVFFDTPCTEQASSNAINGGNSSASITIPASAIGNCNITPAVTSLRSVNNSSNKFLEHQRQIYIGERVNGWRTTGIINLQQAHNEISMMGPATGQHASALVSGGNRTGQSHNLSQTIQTPHLLNSSSNSSSTYTRCNRISAQLLDGVLENSRRPLRGHVKLFSVNDLDDRTDHRPVFTYWINTVQILVLFLSIICYGIGPIGLGIEQKTGQVLVTSLSLQTVQHTEQRNFWIGPRNHDLVHMGAKFATCMRRDVKIMDVLIKSRRRERETACCIRNDDSGCVQSSQADCSVRGLFPTKSISTWKKWSPGESGPGGRISGSVCGLDPKYCDAPASIAPYEWPDDITKWPICRKTNSFSQRFRYKDHTAEHMVCEVIGHPCCTGVYGECRITTREYCDFINGYFHEEASLCSQISCLNNVCGMFPFLSVEVPDQFYRLFTSLCLHAGILHLAITVVFQHVFLADLERLIGPIRTAIIYIFSGLAGNLTSAVLVPYKPEVGPLASLIGVVASLVVLLVLIHWKQLRKPHIALLKLILIGALLFAIGTLPWQLNFVGLLAGIVCGIFLTTAMVPFVSIRKYGRNTKINLIWSCLIFHIFIYSIMLTIFYVFPTELKNLNFGEVLNQHISGGINNINIAENDIMSSSSSGTSNNINPSSTIMQQKKQQQQQLSYYHHHSDDIITNNIISGETKGGEGSKIALLLESQKLQNRLALYQQQSTEYMRNNCNESNHFQNRNNRPHINAKKSTFYKTAKNNASNFFYITNESQYFNVNNNNISQVKHQFKSNCNNMVKGSALKLEKQQQQQEPLKSFPTKNIYDSHRNDIYDNSNKLDKLIRDAEDSNRSPETMLQLQVTGTLSIRENGDDVNESRIITEYMPISSSIKYINVTNNNNNNKSNHNASDNINNNYYYMNNNNNNNKTHNKINATSSVKNNIIIANHIKNKINKYNNIIYNNYNNINNAKINNNDDNNNTKISNDNDNIKSKIRNNNTHNKGNNCNKCYNNNDNNNIHNIIVLTSSSQTTAATKAASSSAVSLTPLTSFNYSNYIKTLLSKNITLKST